MAEYEVTRSTTIAAPPERIRPLIENFHEWRRWSPWEELDPDLKREYSGPESGPGAAYAWEGNRKAGRGRMEILDVQPERIDIRLDFEKPFKASNRTAFELTPRGTDATGVTWRMTGENKGLMAILSRFMSMDKMVGKDFEKGLTRLKSAAESG
jgi:uncharacterized protein YndB with AHSA1/START domain